MDSATLLRRQLARVFDWSDAHVSFDAAVHDFPSDRQGIRPPGLPHSGWELLEHLRITQRDILDFCQAATYRELSWPEQYWPTSPAPLTSDAWDASVAAYRSDRDALQQIALNPEIDLTSVVQHGTGEQTYLRELLLVADHTSYHVGQLIVVRRAFGIWPHV